MRLCKLILSDLILEQELTGFQPEIEALYFNLSSELPLWATKNLAIMMENTCNKIIKSAVAGRQKMHYISPITIKNGVMLCMMIRDYLNS